MLSLQQAVEVHRVVRRRGSPHVLDKWLTDGGEVVRITRRPRLYLQKDFSVLISVRGRVDCTAIVERMLKNPVTSGIETEPSRLVA
jgi:hypothetical protein